MINLSQIEPANLWYFIGYIVSDGNLSIDGRHINITSNDRSHLYLLRNVLFLKCKIGHKNRAAGAEKLYSHLQFSDVKFYRYLQSIGITPNKSLTIGDLKIANKYFTDFLRGLIDGDGNIATWIHRTNLHQQWCVRIYSASTIFIYWLNAEITKHLGVAGRIHTVVSKTKPIKMYILKFGKKSGAFILQKTYYPDCLALERKLISARIYLHSSSKNGKLSTLSPGAGMVDSADLKSVVL